MSLATSHRLSIYTDRGRRTFHRDRAYTRAPFVALFTGHTNANAAGVGPFADGLAIVESSLAALHDARVSDVRDALLAAGTTLAARNAKDSIHVVNTSALVAWDSGDAIQILHAGGGHAFYIRGDSVTALSPPASLARQLRAAGQPITRGAEHVYLNVLGPPQPQPIEHVSQPWQPGDRLVLISAGGDAHADNVPALIASAPSFSALAGHIAGALLHDNDRSVTVIAIELVADS